MAKIVEFEKIYRAVVKITPEEADWLHDTGYTLYEYFGDIIIEEDIDRIYLTMDDPEDLQLFVDCLTNKIYAKQ